ncbi:MAG: hypothetical protein FGM15_03290 [Chthoniobacterales bacterium]|nr:hypothetical protein [Chthoniobacterales bacterium]
MGSSKGSQASAPRRRFRFVLAGLVIVAAAVWIAQGPILRTAVRLALPEWAHRAGYEIEFRAQPSRLFGPLLLGEVSLRDARGSDLRASEVEIDLARIPDLLRRPRHIVQSLRVRGLTGALHLAAASGTKPPENGDSILNVLPAPTRPAVIDIQAPKIFVSSGDDHLLLKDAQMLLSEEQTGTFRAGETGVRLGGASKSLAGLQGVTAWRDGVAYFADVALADDAVVEELSVSLDPPGAVTLKARTFGGSFYGEWTGGARTTAAVSASDISLAGLGKFLGLRNPMRGRIGALKFTFNGDSADPLDAQSSLRVEGKDFSWEKRSFGSLRLGASFSGRHLKIDECSLEQGANRVAARGSLVFPALDWRASAVSLDLDASVSDVRALADLLGRTQNNLSGSLVVQGKLAGRLGDPSGWFRARGWNLRAPGIPVASLQADILFANGGVNISSVESHSGPDFVRASGEISLKDSLTYRGRLEARAREVSRFLEPLGRFAPDWARQGGVLLFWDGDGTESAHSGVVSFELFNFAGDLNPVPVNGKFAATYSPGNFYVSRLLLDRGPLSLSASCYLSGKGLSVQDIQLFNARDRLLRSEIFLPVSFPLLLEGKTWSQTMIPGGEVYAMVRTENLRLGPLANLFGQNSVCEGSVDWRFDASGPWEDPRVESALVTEGLRARFDSFAIPPSRFEAKASVSKRRLDVSGKLHKNGSDLFKLSASVPLLGRRADGGWRVLDRELPATAQLEVARLDLTEFAGLKPLAGEFGGSVKMSGTLSSPNLDGAFDWKDVKISFVDGLEPVTGFSGQLVFAGSEAKLPGAKGKMGEGTFVAEGQCNFADPANMASSAKIAGKNLALVASDNFYFPADVNLAFQRTVDSRTVSGDIALLQSKANVAFSAVPRCDPEGKNGRATELPLPFRVGGWCADCSADIRIHSSEPVEIAQGASASVDVWLTGTLREPVPVGTVDCSGLQVALPAGPLALTRARLYFTREIPLTPVLDLSGETFVSGHRITANMSGPLGQERVEFVSLPELAPARMAELLAATSPAANEAAKNKTSGEKSGAGAELPPPRIGMTWSIR